MPAQSVSNRPVSNDGPVSIRSGPRSGRAGRLFLSALAVASALLVAILVSATPSRAQTTIGPCDIYGADGAPCVAAHSTVRALYADYDGPLYQVIRASDDKTRNITPLVTGGFANAASQDVFCANTTCMITRIYDQSGNHNDLTIEGPGGNGGQDVGAPANALPVTAGGHQVYGVEISAGMGYRNDKTVGVATNGAPEGMYMVTSGTHVNGACCFDYGNAEVSNDDTGNGHMDAINFGTECWFGGCYGKGPWVQADMENGLFQSSQGVGEDPSNTGNGTPFVTALIKNNGQNFMAIKAGDATAGPLTTTFSGTEPTVNGGGYAPMHQEGAIVLGTGGDNSNGSIGSFFEGVMTAGVPSDTADNNVQANIVAVGYGAPTGLTGSLKAGSEIALQATTSCCTSDYLTEASTTSGTGIVLAPFAPAGNVAAQQLATWIVRKGLASSSCVSFESKTNPGDYIRHYNFVLYHEPYDGTDQFAKDATFCPKPGNDGQGKSFESYDYPTHYIRHYQAAGYIATNGGTAQPWDTSVSWTYDTSFLLAVPAAP